MNVKGLKNIGDIATGCPNASCVFVAKADSNPTNPNVLSSVNKFGLEWC